MRRRFTDEEVDARMVPQIVAAIYPILIPFEEQSVEVQTENHKQMTVLARELWRAFMQLQSTDSIVVPTTTTDVHEGEAREP